MVRSLSLPKRRLHIVIPGLTENLLLQSVQVKTLGVFFIYGKPKRMRTRINKGIFKSRSYRDSL